MRDPLSRNEFLFLSFGNQMKKRVFEKIMIWYENNKKLIFPNSENKRIIFTRQTSTKGFIKFYLNLKS